MTRQLLSKIVFACVIPVAHAAPTVINFEDLGPDQVVGSHYANLGVHFVNAKIAPIRNPNHKLPPFGTYPGASFPSTIVSMETAFNGFQPQQSNPIIARFDFDASAVSLTGLGVNEHGFLLRAYDSTLGGALVATAQVFGPPHPPDDLFFNLTVTSQKIRRVEFSQILQLNFPLNYDDTWFDNLVVTPATPVPEPEKYLLFGFGLAALSLVRRWTKAPSC